VAPNQHRHHQGGIVTGVSTGPGPRSAATVEGHNASAELINDHPKDREQNQVERRARARSATRRDSEIGLKDRLHPRQLWTRESLKRPSR
jgi:hypothetical protein